MDPQPNPSNPQPPAQDAYHVPVNRVPASPPPQPHIAMPPQPPPVAVTQSSSTEPIKPQIVQDIPVRQQGQAPAVAVAAVPAAHQPAKEPDSKDDELDAILQAVNSRVKQPVAQKSGKTQQVAKKVATHAGKFKLKLPGGRPVGAVLVSVAVALILSATAIMAYHQGQTSKLASQPGKVGTSDIASNSIQQAGGTLVRPSDLDDFSNGLQTKLDSLNDGQDFSSTPLSDKMLGL
jgi:hypothetical protein